MDFIPDIGEARRFLAMLAPDGDVVFQTFADDDDLKDRDPDAARKLAWTTRKIDALPAMNARRAGIFLTVNRVDGDRRKADKVTGVRSLFADFDGTELPDAWGLEPSAIVNTSPGKFHSYWFSDGDFPREEFSAAQRAIAGHFGTDPVVSDLPRVMRLPGFWHRKGDGYQVRIVEASGIRYSVETLQEWIARISPEPEPERPKAERRSSLNGSTSPYVKAAVESALASIANAPKGNRNTTLNSEAFGIFGLVKAGVVPESIRDDIERVALATGMTKTEVKATIKSAWTDAKPRHVPEPTYSRRETVPDHDPDTGEIIEPKPATKNREKARPVSINEAPFRMLGYNRGVYFYLPKRGGQVVELKAHEHTELRLYAIAPLSYWQGIVNAKDDMPSEKQWKQIAHSLIQNQHDEGIFEETRLRGRGAWMDGKRVIVHTGGEALIDGAAVPLDGVNSRYIYEVAPPWDFGFGKPATNAEAHRLPQICERLTWEDKLSGAMLAGWCVIAPVCGALPWRPHIWITGSSGSGKTTAQNDVVGRLVGPAAERFDGGTSEAAIRQTIGHDARPAIMDEAEGEDQESIKQMQGVLKLARVASSGGKISKGGSSHRAVTFMVRSCFCFSSIHTALRLQSDESRVTKLVLLPNMRGDAAKHYRDLIRDINAWFTPEYAASMFARTIENLPTLLKNIETFTQAAAIEFRSRRAADQVGAMLAGYFLCRSPREISAEDAAAFIRRNRWTDHVPIDAQSDEMRLFQFIMTRRVRATIGGGTGDHTIGTLLEMARMSDDKGRDAGVALGAYGIKVHHSEIYISNDAQNLRELFLRDAPQYAGDWRRPLMQLPGAARTAGGVRFGPGLNTRAVVLPYGLLDGSYVAREPGEEG